MRQRVLSYQEIAQILNISNENVRKRISQARKILRDRLREYEGGIDRKSLSSQTSRQSPHRTHKSSVKPERLTGSGEIEQIESVVEEVSPELNKDENLLAVEPAVISGEELTTANSPVSPLVIPGITQQSRRSPNYHLARTGFALNCGKDTP